MQGHTALATRQSSMLYGMSYIYDLYMVYYDGLLDTPEIFTQKAG